MGEWWDLIMEKVKELEQQRKADEEQRKADEAMLERLKSYLSDPVANQKGTSLAFADNKCAVAQLKVPVFTTWVSDGRILLTPEGAQTESFTVEQQAHALMGTLVAKAIMKARDEEDKRRRETEDAAT